MSGEAFIKALIFNHLSQKETSLCKLNLDLSQNYGCKISKPALHKRFTPEAVMFLKQGLSKQLSAKLKYGFQSIQSNNFSAICIKDSTKFKLPDCFIADYPGYGHSHGKSANLSIQYEYDILSGEWNDFNCTKISRNDQLDSKETIDKIISGSLNLRDLGYVTSNYLKGVEEMDAFYLNRLPKIGVYVKNNGTFEAFNWKKIHSQMKKNNCSLKEIEVFLGPNKNIKTRLILSPVSNETVERRLRIAQKRIASRPDYNKYSQEYKIKSHYNIFITNVPSDILKADQIHEVYRLRWQIELIFKAWKSEGKINQLKTMKKERFECHLIAHFIWFLMSWKIYLITNRISINQNQKKAISILKFYKVINYRKAKIEELLNNKTGFVSWLRDFIIELTHISLIEKRLGKSTHYELLKIICAS